MRKLRCFSIGERAEAWLLRDRLQQEGIAVLLRNEELFAAMGEIPFIEIRPELWVIDDEVLPRAQSLLAAWQQQATDVQKEWRCPDCGEWLEGQFGACWKCGRARSE